MPKAGQVSKEEHEQAHSWWEMIDPDNKAGASGFHRGRCIAIYQLDLGCSGPRRDYRHEMPQ
jgi:hypothetical protein